MDNAWDELNLLTQHMWKILNPKSIGGVFELNWLNASTTCNLLAQSTANALVNY